MVTAATYRNEAERCRALAAAARDAQAAERWLRIARDYDALADAVAAEQARPGVPPVMRTPMQHSVQQQHSKTTREGEAAGA